MGNAPAVGIVLLVRGGMQRRHFLVLGLVLEAKFFEDNDDFPWVGATTMGVESDGLRHGECWEGAMSGRQEW